MQTTIKTRFSCLLILASFVSIMAGCDQLPTHPPQTVTEYVQHERARKQEFLPKTIAFHNAHRVLDDSLAADSRLESLRVLERVDVAGEQTYPTLAIVLTQQQTPPEVRRNVLAFLADRDCPGLAEHVAAALPDAADAQVRSVLLDWLSKHPARVSLVSVVKLWASEKPISDANETRYRQLVERISGKTWSDALLNGLNRPKFFARGSAIEILSSRLGPERLRREISAIEPRTQAAAVLKYFATNFGYVPGTKRELLAEVTLHRKGPSRLTPAQRTATQWQKMYDYNFNIRDFHLASRLDDDPTRKKLSRAELILKISRGIITRRATKTKHLFRRGRLVDFASQAEGLSIADMWNLMLISEMLDRKSVRRALRVTARQDMADKNTQFGGLIKCKRGRAEAMLYPASEKQGDDKYIPTKQMLKSALDSLCYFVGHFSEVAENASRIGPGEKELAFAAKNNICGVVFTTVGNGRLNATYFTPGGIVVDLGEFKE